MSVKSLGYCFLLLIPLFYSILAAFGQFLSPYYWDDIPALFHTTQTYLPPGWRAPEPYGFLTFGDSGCGKSLSLEQIALIFRRVISHEAYLGEPLPLRQVPMLIVRCPDNGSIGAFLQEFLSAADALLHTDYHMRYVRSSKDLTGLKKGVKAVCRNHNIGAIFVDEAQNLARENATTLVAYLARFNETVNVPLVLVGTPDIREVWQSSFSAGRRLSGSGPIELLRFPLSSHNESPLYKFCMKLEKYQFTREVTPMTTEIIDALGMVSGGNPDQLKKAWIFVQSKAIELKRDDKSLTEEDVLSIKGKFSIVEKALELIAQQRWVELAETFKDLDPSEVVFVPPSTIKPPNGKVPTADNPSDHQSVGLPDEQHVDLPTTATVSSESTDTTENVPNPLLKKTQRVRAKVNKLLSNQAGSDRNTTKPDGSGYNELKDQGLVGFE